MTPSFSPPHFHRQVSDGTETLYTDSDESIFSVLREEIDAYESMGGGARVLLSVEADIVSLDGGIALPRSREAPDALDFVTPTMNYHPLLPLKFVRPTYGKCVDALARRRGTRRGGAGGRGESGWGSLREATLVACLPSVCRGSITTRCCA